MSWNWNLFKEQYSKLWPSCTKLIYHKYNFLQHGILVENMFDLPYLHHKYITAETTSTMTRVCTEIRKLVPANVPCGLQVFKPLCFIHIE